MSLPNETATIRGHAKGVEAPLCQVGNARGEIEAEQICQGEVVIADAAAIGVMSSDAQVGLVVEPSMT